MPFSLLNNCLLTVRPAEGWADKSFKTLGKCQGPITVGGEGTVGATGLPAYAG